MPCMAFMALASAQEKRISPAAILGLMFSYIRTYVFPILGLVFFEARVPCMAFKALTSAEVSTISCTFVLVKQVN